MRKALLLAVLVVIAAGCADTGVGSGDAASTADNVTPTVSDSTASDEPSADDPTPPGEPSPDESDQTSDTTGPGRDDNGSTEDNGGTLVESELTVTPVDPETPSTEPDPGTPLPVLEEGKIPRALEPFVEAARQDLAATLGVDPSEIGVAIAEFVVWPDGSLGCPQAGMEYIQVQVDGSRAVLTHAGAAYSYHGGGSRPGPFLCTNPVVPPG